MLRHFADLVFLSALLAGCVAQPPPHAPRELAAPDRNNPIILDAAVPADARIRHVPSKWDADYELIWQRPGSAPGPGTWQVRADEVVDLTVRYLEKELGPVPEINRQVHTAESGATYCDQTLCIVAIDPVIVVIIPQRCVWRDRMTTTEVSVRGPGAEPIKTVRAALPYGFDYGTHIPYDQDILWFSPELKIPPQPFHVVTDIDYRARLPDGRVLRLNPSKAQWVVSLGRDDDGSRLAASQWPPNLFAVQEQSPAR
jgi:hypothetical protein